MPELVYTIIEIPGFENREKLFSTPNAFRTSLFTEIPASLHKQGTPQPSKRNSRESAQKEGNFLLLLEVLEADIFSEKREHGYNHVTVESIKTTAFTGKRGFVRYGTEADRRRVH